ncbi:MAG: flotillin domain-containing protein [Pseudomonadota bacterium]
MSGQIIGTIVLWLIVAVAVIAVIVWLLNWLYHRATKEVSFVRTGFGGERVVINGGALVLPIIHEVTPVGMTSTRLRIVREKDDALITKDRMRVDIEADFFVRVIPSKEGVSAAATSLGSRTMASDQLGELLEGKFVSALRAAAAEMTLDAMHEQRVSLVDSVSNRAADILARDGLELDSVAITDLDQTELEYFNPANRFDAEGLTQLIGTIEERRKLRNDIEQSSLVSIRARNLAAEKETLEIDRESYSAQLDQERQKESIRAAQNAEIARIQAEREAEAAAARIASEQETSSREIARRQAVEQAEIQAREETEQRRIAHERTLELSRIEREQAIRAQQIAETNAVELARISAEEQTEQRDITRTKALDTARIESQKEVDTARISQEMTVAKARIEREQTIKSMQIGERQATTEAEIASREEIERARIATDRGLEEARIIFERDMRRLEVERAQVLELAEIEKEIEVLKRRADENTARVATERARAEAAVAEEEVATSRETEVARRIASIDKLIAEKDADMAKIAAGAEKIRAAVVAEAERLRNEADNVLSDDARAGRLRSQLLEKLEGIVRESVRPLDNIDGIKIVQMSGLTDGQPGYSSRSPTDEVIDSALRFRAQAPLIDEMMKEIGVENSGVAKMGDIFRSAKDAASLAKTNKGGDD